jgi:hypothetical protein
MKKSKWVGLLTIAILPFYSGCAQAPGGYPTRVVSSGPPAEGVSAPVATAAPGQGGYDAPAPITGPGAPPVEANAAEMQTSATVPANMSPATAEVIKMAESGVTEDVLLAYVQKSNSRYDLNADTILYLKDLGITSPVITAMVTRDGALPAQAQQAPPPPPQEQPQQPPPGPGSQGAVTGPLVEAAQPTYVSNPPADVNYFYQDLSPYGTWVVLDGVGWCWQPRAVVVNHAWRPYCDSGHWVWTDTGWFWQSDYSWGWAPFHYGRWYMHDRCGWVWCPDRTWGPAWVTWRVAGDNCGWAPLPPFAVFEHGGWRYRGASVAVTFDFGLRPDHFTFIAVHDFTRHDYVHSRLSVTQVRTVYSHTTIVNNTTVVNNTIVNRGVPAERVAEVTHTKIQKVSIKSDSVAPAHMAKASSAERSGVVYRHEVKAPAQPVKAVAQKVDQQHPVVQHAEFKPAQPAGAVSARSNPFTRTTSPLGTQRNNSSVNSTRSAVSRNSAPATAPGRNTASPAPNRTGRLAEANSTPSEPNGNAASQRKVVTPPSTPRNNSERPSPGPSSSRSENSAASRSVPKYYDSPAGSSSSRGQGSGSQYSPKGADRSYSESRSSSRAERAPGNDSSSRSSRGNDSESRKH